MTFKNNEPLYKEHDMQFKSNEQLGVNSQDTFLKLKDREHANGVFRGNPFEFKQHWIANRSYPCKGNGCEHCAKQVKSTFRFRLNFVLKDPSSPQGYVAKVFEQGLSVYESLRALAESGYNLEKTIVKISRNGTGQNTSYTIVPLPNPLQPQSEQFISQVKLHDLTNFSEQNNTNVPNGNEPPADHFGYPPMDDIPF
jgi:hypothetical protein